MGRYAGVAMAGFALWFFWWWSRPVVAGTKINEVAGIRG